MNNLELQVTTLMRLCTAETSTEQAQLRQELRRLLTLPQPRPADPEAYIREILLDLGAPDHLTGHPYVVEAVIMALENRSYLNSITFCLYPHLAAKFDTTASRVERAIRHLIEVTWMRGDMDVLRRYFGNTVSADRGKPTNGEFLARITNIVQQQLKKAA